MSPPNYIGDSKMAKEALVDHSIVSTDNGTLALFGFSITS
jgi:hypothetical protein